MNRRSFLGAVLASVSLGSAAEAKDYADDVLRQLRRNGYEVISVSRTLLGRTRIRATRKGGEREIILNAATGEILRDVWIAGGSGDGGLWDAEDDSDDRSEEDRNDDKDDDKDEEKDDDRDDDKDRGDKGGGGGGGGDDDD